METMGVISIVIFFAAVIASIRGWIPQRVLPIQSTLVLAGFAIILIGIVFNRVPCPGEYISLTYMHPITATIVGFIFAGALKSAGGFDAAAQLIRKITKTRFGYPFAIILLVNIPIIFAMPCGRIWVSPLMPVALFLGFDIALEKNDMTMPAMVVFGMIVNAAASCAPSLIGGIGIIGEGLGGYPSGSFSNHHQIAIMVITVITMLLVNRMYSIEVKHTTVESSIDTGPREVPKFGYFSLGFFVLCIGLTVLIRPAFTLQAILLIMTVVLMFLARLSFMDLIQGIMLHPLTAMVAGFFMGGVLKAFGGFDVLMSLLDFTALNTPLGYIGVAVIIIYLPIIFPMPCGRIIAVTLIPAVVMLGETLNQVTGFSGAGAALLVSFILAGAASCAPSPIGGIGGIGAGNLRLQVSSVGKSMSMGIFIGVPVAALTVSLLGLAESLFTLPLSVIALSVGVLCGISINMMFGEKFHHAGGIMGGLAVGALIILF